MLRIIRTGRDITVEDNRNSTVIRFASLKGASEAEQHLHETVREYPSIRIGKVQDEIGKCELCFKGEVQS